MPTSIFLPAEEDTLVTITVKGKNPVDVDIFELEDMFVTAENKAKDMNTEWREEFPAIYKRKTGRPITPSQAVLLWEGIRDRITELKKSLLNGSDDSEKPVSKSRRKVKKKSG
jgi:hypothetical protein